MDLADQVARDRDVIRTESAAALAIAGDHWETLVPTCPEWTVGQLLTHMGRAQRMATANLTNGGERVSPRTLSGPPEGKDAILEWFVAGLADLLEAIDTTDLEAPAWTFAPTNQRAWWWARRQAQENMVHRWDAEHAVVTAAGRTDVTGFVPDVAAAGIDEHLCDFFPLWPKESRGDLHGTLHVHTTDADGEWVLDLDDPAAPTRRDHAKADTAVRGPATEVLLWLWNRRAATAPIETFGDGSVVAGWSRIAI
jgi:uncharacterized protein (TIGR03083 family)